MKFRRPQANDPQSLCNPSAALRWLGTTLLLTASLHVTAVAQQMPSPASNPVPEIAQSLHAGQFADALKLAGVAIQRNPRDPRLYALQALSYAGLKRETDAMQSYQKALRIAPNYLPALQGAAQLAYATHNQQAPVLLQRLVQLQPADQTAHAMLGELAFARGDCKETIAQFDDAREAVASRADALLHLSSCLVKLSRVRDAIPVFQQILALDSQNTSARYDLALAQQDAGDHAAAEATIAPLLAQPAPAEDELTLASEIAEAQGQTQRALDLLRNAIMLHPHEKSAYLDFANLAFRHASIPVGLDVVDLGIKQIPDQAELYFARGVLLCQIGRVDEGFTAFARANQLDPRLGFVGVAQGIAQSLSHRPQAALAQFRVQVRQHPRDPLAWYLLAEALSEQGYAVGTAGARETLQAARRAVQLDPAHADAQNLLASICLDAGDIPGAIAASRAALAVNPQDTQALYHLVLAERKTDHKDLPDLMRRLMDARRQADEAMERNRPRTLVEVHPGAAEGRDK